MLGPNTESTGRISLHPVREAHLEQTTFLVPIVRRVDPIVKTASDLHLRRASDEVGHYFLAEGLHLIDRVLLYVLGYQDVILNLLYRILVVSLSALKLSDIVVVNFDFSVRHRLLPVCHRDKLLIPLNAASSPIQEFLCQLESSDEQKP